MTLAFDWFMDGYSKSFSRDGPPLHLLDQMDEKERDKIETLLLRKVNPDDLDSIKILGYLRSQQAFTSLVEMLPEAEDVSQVYIAKALWQIRKYEPAAMILCQTVTLCAKISETTLPRKLV